MRGATHLSARQEQLVFLVYAEHPQRVTFDQVLSAFRSQTLSANGLRYNLRVLVERGWLDVACLPGSHRKYWSLSEDGLACVDLPRPLPRVAQLEASVPAPEPEPALAAPVELVPPRRLDLMAAPVYRPRQPVLRAGALDYQRYPSRRGSRRVWRDGRRA